MATTISLHHHLESIPDQVGIAILRSQDGSMIQQPSGTLLDHDVQILYQMLLEIGGILVSTGNTSTGSEKGGESLKRFTVEMGGGGGGGDGGEREKISYSVCVTGDGFVYIVKRRQ
mmetsp:Transcript_6605/g.7665  ORF Transcript_6605/g.7665 Transcript_6605/m.7665 type:complete len:116 (+) Transcript_6605:30-377(+)